MNQAYKQTVGLSDIDPLESHPGRYGVGEYIQVRSPDSAREPGPFRTDFFLFADAMLAHCAGMRFTGNLNLKFAHYPNLRVPQAPSPDRDLPGPGPARGGDSDAEPEPECCSLRAQACHNAVRSRPSEAPVPRSPPRSLRFSPRVSWSARPVAALDSGSDAAAAADFTTSSRRVACPGLTPVTVTSALTNSLQHHLRLHLHKLSPQLSVS